MKLADVIRALKNNLTISSITQSEHTALFTQKVNNTTRKLECGSIFFRIKHQQIGHYQFEESDLQRLKHPSNLFLPLIDYLSQQPININTAKVILTLADLLQNLDITDYLFYRNFELAHQEESARNNNNNDFEKNYSNKPFLSINVNFTAPNEQHSNTTDLEDVISINNIVLN